jgi:hypothetical protein
MHIIVRNNAATPGIAAKCIFVVIGFMVSSLSQTDRFGTIRSGTSQMALPATVVGL